MTSSAPTLPPPSPAALDPVFDRLHERVTAGDVPSAALAIGGADGPIRAETFSGAGEIVDADSLFFLASVTKPIFATAFMQLVDDGLLDLHEPIARFLPEFAAAADDGGAPGRDTVTAWHLLTHTSGVPDILPDVIRGRRPSAARMLRLTMSAPLSFEPGTRWEYCSASFYLLGELMRRLGGLPYPVFLRERLFEPLGMAATFDPRGSARRLVTVHGVGAENRLRRWLLLRYVAGIAVPGGGLWGTLDDLLRFGAALLRPRRRAGRWLPLSPPTVALTMKDHTHGLTGNFEGEEGPVHFGLSWAKPTMMGELPGSARVVAHGGATGTLLWIDPDAELVFVYLTNQWDPDRGPELEALTGVYSALGSSG